LLQSAFIRSDNDPEFIAKTLKRWLAACRVNTLDIELVPPWENTHSETFVSRLGDELLRSSTLAFVIKKDRYAPLPNAKEAMIEVSLPYQPS